MAGGIVNNTEQKAQNPAEQKPAEIEVAPQQTNKSYEPPANLPVGELAPDLITEKYSTAEPQPEIQKQEPKAEEIFYTRPVAKEPPEPVKEYLRRDEVRSMEKDTIRLQELEAKKERERVAALETLKERLSPKDPEQKQEQPKEPPFIVPAPVVPIPPSPDIKPIPEKGVFIPQTLKKPSALTKIFVRAGILGIFLALVLAAGFFYWYFNVKKTGTTIKPAIEAPIKSLIETPVALIPPALISTDAAVTLNVLTAAEIPTLLPQTLQGIQSQGFNRILIKNAQNNEIVGLKEFLDSFNAKYPAGLLEKMDNNFTLFAYAGTTTRLGFVAKINDKQGFDALVSIWESTMEKDTESLFAALGKTNTAVAQNFKTSNYQGSSFRYLTISKSDFGICYSIIGDYFIFATSFESAQKSIDAVKTGQQTKNSGQLFIVGIEGTEITPKTEELFKKYRPGGVLLLAKNIKNEAQLKRLTSGLQELSLRETGFPLFIAVDQEGGVVSRVSFAKERTSQSSIENTEQAYQVGKARGEELKGMGINLNLAPVLDTTNKTDFLFNRSFQKTPAEIGELTKSLILGEKTAGILTTIKHFPGYGGISFNPEVILAKTNKTPEISQFKTALEANPEFVMTANAVYTDIDPFLPFTFSPKSIQFLKDSGGGNAVIISDDLSQNYLLTQMSLKDLMVKPVEAGVDVLIISGWQIPVVKTLDAFNLATEKGEVSADKIKASVAKIIQLKQNLLQSIYTVNR